MNNNRFMIKGKLFIIISLLVLIASCAREPAIVHSFEMKNNGWGKFSNLEFNQGSFKKNKAYSIRLDLVIDDNYPDPLFEFQLLIESEEGESWNKVFSVAIKDDDGNFLERSDFKSQWHGQ